jgi:hypothetical protein
VKASSSLTIGFIDMHAFTTIIGAACALVACAAAQAQVRVQPLDAQAPAVVLQGSQISRIPSSDKNINTVVAHWNASANRFVFTEIAHSAKGELERLKANSVAPAQLRPAGEYGSRVETEDNSYFDGKVHVLTLTCATMGENCVEEQEFNTEDGKPAPGKSAASYLKLHFKELSDAQRALDEVMAKR